MKKEWVITDSEINRIIKNRIYMKQNLKYKRAKIVEDIKDTEESLNYYHLSSSDWSNSGDNSGTVSDPTYNAVIKRTESGLYEKLLMLQSKLADINSQESVIERVCISFEALSDIFPLAFNIVFELYYKSSYKDRTVESYATEFHISKNTIINYKKTIVESIKTLYQTELNTYEISLISTQEISEILKKNDSLKKAIEREKM